MTVRKFCLPTVRLHIYVSFSCHIVQDEWWSAATAAHDSIAPYLNHPHTRPVRDNGVLVQVDRHAIVTAPFQKRPTSYSFC